MQRWIHKTEYLRFQENVFNFETDQDNLFRNMAFDGWELVSVVKTQFRDLLTTKYPEIEDWMVYYFKRPVGRE